MSYPIDEIIRSRRNRKVFDGSPVSRETIIELLSLATMAPMHGLTNPWHFRVLDKAALEGNCTRLNQFIRFGDVVRPRKMVYSCWDAV